MEIELPREIFEKLSRIKFNENTSSGNRVDPCRPMDGRTDRHDEYFRNFANVPKNREHFQYDLWRVGCLIFGYILNILRFQVNGSVNTKVIPCSLVKT